MIMIIENNICVRNYKGVFKMKKAIFAVLAAAGMAVSLASCKSNTNDLPNNNAADRTYQNSNVRMPNNGEVTDRNGIIGDNDDLVVDRYGRTYNDRTDTNRVGDTVNNAARNAGDIVDNTARNAGDIVNNIADKTGDTVENIADNVGDTVKHATR